MKITNPFRSEKKTVPDLSVRTETAAAGQSQERIETVSLVEADTAAAQAANAAAVQAERERISAINFFASPEQAEMRDKFVADGTPALKAAMALHEDAKTRTPQLTEEGIAKAMLKQLNAVVLPAAPTLAQEDKSVLAQFKAIKDPRESAEFYAAHKAEIDNLSNHSAKEGK